MNELYQLCYVSSTTARHPEIFDDLRNIITEARHFNYQHQITGVLCYANYYFFQCLEGTLADLDLVTTLIKQDPRHYDLVFSETKRIVQRDFSDWSMKFVGKQSEIQHVLNSYGYEDFGQLKFESEALEEILLNLRSAQAEEFSED